MNVDRAWAATRKGLFELRRRSGQAWQVHGVSFLGDPVSQLLPPDDQGRMLAALNLGHFGVKLHASRDAGASWQEVAAPAYPPQPEGAPGIVIEQQDHRALEDRAVEPLLRDQQLAGEEGVLGPAPAGQGEPCRQGDGEQDQKPACRVSNTFLCGR